LILARYWLGSARGGFISEINVDYANLVPLLAFPCQSSRPPHLTVPEFDDHVTVLISTAINALLTASWLIAGLI
jgi:hypothetical protein